MSTIEDRLAALGLTLPEPRAPVANYVPFVRAGALVHISGQVSVDAAGGVRGIVGEDVDMATAVQAARLCAINLIAQFKAACDGDLGRVKRIVKLNGFVQAGPGCFEIPQVVNGASDLMVEVFGEAGRHARSAVSAASLPFGVAVEIEAVFEVE